VGDSLIEPFWPEGTGIGQGFLRYPVLWPVQYFKQFCQHFLDITFFSVLDTAWMLKRYFEGEDELAVKFSIKYISYIFTVVVSNICIFRKASQQTTRAYFPVVMPMLDIFKRLLTKTETFILRHP
jgi:hypothetical protein